MKFRCCEITTFVKWESGNKKWELQSDRYEVRSGEGKLGSMQCHM